MKNNNTGFLIVAIILIALVALVCAPFVVLWAIDGVFGTNLPVTLKSWFCTLLLLLVFGGGEKIVFKRK